MCLNNRLLLSCVVVLAGMLSAQNRSVIFEEGSLEETKQKAKKENKLIFIDTYATWCLPCKYLEKELFTRDSIADFYNTHFLNLKIDIEKGEGIDFARGHKISLLPTLVFLNANGEVIHQLVGFNDEALVLLGKQILEGKNILADYKKKYEEDNNNLDNLHDYLTSLGFAGISEPGLAEKYFSMQKQQDLFNEKNWFILRLHIRQRNSTPFLFLINNIDKYIHIYSAKSVEAYIYNCFNRELQIYKTSRNYSDTGYQQLKKEFLATHFDVANRLIFNIETGTYASKKNWDAYSKLVSEKTDIVYPNSAVNLNQIALIIYENIDDKNMLIKAENWAKKSTEIEENYGYVLTYAKILYKNGKNNEALNKSERALQLAKNKGISVEELKETEDLIAKIKSDK